MKKNYNSLLKKAHKLKEREEQLITNLGDITVAYCTVAEIDIQLEHDYTFIRSDLVVKICKIRCQIMDILVEAQEMSKEDK